MAIKIAQTITRGIKPLDRRSGLRDSVLSGLFGSDRFSPNYILVVNGETMPDEVTQHIVDIEYEDNEELFDQIKITLKGWKQDGVFGRDIPVPEWIQKETIFSEGNLVWVFMGYGGQERLIGGGEIVRREFNYGAEPSCDVICYEPLHRMAGEFAEKAIVYKGMRSSDIVKKIARKGVYSGAIGALFDVSNIDRLPIVTPRAEVQKRGESDYAFLKRMADVRGWHLFTRFDERKRKFALFYGPDVDKQEELFRYEYNPREDLLPEDTLLSFKPEINIIDQNSEVEISSFNEKKKKNVQSKQKYTGLADGKLTLNRKFTSGNTDFKNTQLQNPTEYRVRAFGISKKVVTNRPFKDDAEAKKFIINWARETIKNFITGNGRISGNEVFQSRQAHIFMGLGETFSGTESKPAKWYLTKVVHKISVGSSTVYSTEFDCRKVIDWIPNDDIQLNVPALQSAKEAASKQGRLTSIANSFA